MIPFNEVYSSKTMEDDTFLWRYFDLHKLVSFLSSKSLFFSRMDRFEDLNEGISKNQLFTHYQNRDPDYRNVVHGELALDIRQKRMFASCWFYGKRESVAMWNLYASASGAALRLKALDLLNEFRNRAVTANNLESIGNAYHGPVFYKDFLNPSDIEDFKEETRVIGFQKDKSFEHENEYRFLVRQRYNDPSDDFLEYIELKLEGFSDLQFELIFHPKMQGWQKQNIRELLNAYQITNIAARDSELKLQ